MTDLPWDEDARLAAVQERFRVAALPDADARLALVRIAISRWSVIQWWLLESIGDWRKLVTEHASAGCHTASLKAAIRGGRARTVRVVPTGHLVQAIGNGYITLGDAINCHYSIDGRMRGEARFVAYEYTGTRRRRTDAAMAAAEVAP